MRKIQTTYKLEPAGSHGVWGLDDYHFLPFFFGASELCGHPRYTPNSIHDDSILSRESNDYLYFHCIEYIKQVKSSGHFGEHSPMLNDISAVPNWEKVSTGLVKMYQNEVMNKFPVMKHFFFGSIISFNPE
jgi:serine/threonine-protein phosphatase 2A activator